VSELCFVRLPTSAVFEYSEACLPLNSSLWRKTRFESGWECRTSQHICAERSGHGWQVIGKDNVGKAWMIIMLIDMIYIHRAQGRVHEQTCLNALFSFTLCLCIENFSHLNIDCYSRMCWYSIWILTATQGCVGTVQLIEVNEVFSLNLVPSVST
jgi:hypothetical protein